MKPTAQPSGAVPPPTTVADTDEAEIRENLAKLSAADRALAEQQKYCAIETDSRLGSMGVPMKVMVRAEPVFVCCRGCKSDVEKHPDEALKKVQELREKNAK